MIVRVLTQIHVYMMQAFTDFLKQGKYEEEGKAVLEMLAEAVAETGVAAHDMTMADVLDVFMSLRMGKRQNSVPSPAPAGAVQFIAY
jgi:hypothetical protein